VLRFFEKKTSQCTTIYLFLSTLIFAHCCLFVDVVFSTFVYADITLQTVALDTPINMAVLLQILQLNANQQSGLFQNRTSLRLVIAVTKQTEEELSVLPTGILSM
jgi:hypothetical protein